jgi:nucleotide-binding universal stress UspA family protein
MKRILVPTDFSVQAENALKVACQLAQKNDATIYLMHSMEMPLHLATDGDKGQLPEALFFIKMAENRFAELMERPYLENVTVHDIIAQGELYKDMKLVVDKHDIDLIIMGSHGASGFQEMFIGSNAEKVVRTSSIPVLVIKNAHETFEVTDLVFACDLSDECKKPFVNAVRFADAFGAKTHLLYVNTPSGFKTTAQTRDMLHNFVQGTGAENFTLNVYNDLSVEKGVLNFASENNLQLIGISTHGRKGLSHFFNGSISEDMVNHAQMPVLTFKIEES